MTITIQKLKITRVRITNQSSQLQIYITFTRTVLFKGAMSRGFLPFGLNNVLKFKLNAFSRTHNTPG